MPCKRHPTNLLVDAHEQFTFEEVILKVMALGGSDILQQEQVKTHTAEASTLKKKPKPQRLELPRLVRHTK